MQIPILEYVVDYNIDVTLTSGYTYPTINNSINNGTFPKDLQYVCLELVKKIFIEATGKTNKTKVSNNRVGIIVYIFLRAMAKGI